MISTEICETCMEQLKEAFKFRKKCLESNKKLFRCLAEEQSIETNVSLEEDNFDIDSNDTTSKYISKSQNSQIEQQSDVLNKKFTCPMCLRTFSNKHCMHRHQKIHSENNDLKCKVCCKQFSRMTDVKRHMSRHTGTYSKLINKNHFHDI